MDDKAITCIHFLALMQIQVNALVLLLEQQLGVSVKEDSATYQRRCVPSARNHAGDQEPHL
jgi:hypothetical protein